MFCFMKRKCPAKKKQFRQKKTSLIKSGFLCALQHGGKGAALQNIFHAVILAVLFVQLPIGSKIAGNFRVAQVLADQASSTGKSSLVQAVSMAERSSNRGP